MQRVVAVARAVRLPLMPTVLSRVARVRCEGMLAHHACSARHRVQYAFALLRCARAHMRCAGMDAARLHELLKREPLLCDVVLCTARLYMLKGNDAAKAACSALAYWHDLFCCLCRKLRLVVLQREPLATAGALATRRLCNKHTPMNPAVQPQRNRAPHASCSLSELRMQAANSRVLRQIPAVQPDAHVAKWSEVEHLFAKLYDA